jgi:hypothetical protein
MPSSFANKPLQRLAAVGLLCTIAHFAMTGSSTVEVTAPYRVHEAQPAITALDLHLESGADPTYAVKRHVDEEPAPMVHASSEKQSYPVRWKVGGVDPRFHLTPDEVKTAAIRAISLWEDAAGKRLFDYDPVNGIPVELIYDDRQQKINDSNAAEAGLALSRSELDALRRRTHTTERRSEEARQSYEFDKQLLHDRFAAHNRRVDDLNASGGATEEERDMLNSEATSLEREQRHLELTRIAVNGLIDDAQTATDAYNAAVDSLNRSVSDFNSKFGLESEDEVGVCDLLDEKPIDIKVFAFLSKAHLTHILAHEFGHALGLKHIESEGAIMNAVDKNAHDEEQPSLTPADKAALRTTIRR